MKQPRLVIYKDALGEWRWRLIAANGRVVADSGEGYRSRRNAIHAAAKLQAFTLRAKITYEIPHLSPAKRV